MNFREFAATYRSVPRDKLIFISLGNPICGDDGAAHIFCEKLKQRKEFSAAHFINAGTTPENYLTQIEKSGAEVVTFIDIAKTGKSAGHIHFLDPSQLDNANFSTHTYSIDLIERYLNLGGPKKFYYLVIEPHATKINSALSRPVQKSLETFFSAAQQNV